MDSLARSRRFVGTRVRERELPWRQRGQLHAELLAPSKRYLQPILQAVEIWD